MAQRFLQDPSALGTGYPIIGNNSVQLSVGDAVTIDSDGFLDIAGTTTKILGYSLENITMSASNETVAKVCPKYVYAENVLMVYPADQACTQTDIGQYADLSSATTNAQTLNLNSGGTGQFLVVGFDPTNDGTTTDTVVIAAERTKDAYAQT